MLVGLHASGLVCQQTRTPACLLASMESHRTGVPIHRRPSSTDARSRADKWFSASNSTAARSTRWPGVIRGGRTVLALQGLPKLKAGVLYRDLRQPDTGKRGGFYRETGPPLKGFEAGFAGN